MTITEFDYNLLRSRDKVLGSYTFHRGNIAIPEVFRWPDMPQAFTPTRLWPEPKYLGNGTIYYNMDNEETHRIFAAFKREIRASAKYVFFANDLATYRIGIHLTSLDGWSQKTISATVSPGRNIVTVSPGSGLWEVSGISWRLVPAGWPVWHP
jgi:hypothetical protein